MDWRYDSNGRAPALPSAKPTKKEKKYKTKNSPSKQFWYATQELQFEAGHGKISMRSYAKCKVKIDWGRVSVVKNLPAKCQALSLIPSTPKKKKKKVNLNLYY
jgi:hypothetical protein